MTDPPYGIGGNMSRKGGFPRQRWDLTVEVRDAAIARWQDHNPDAVRPQAVFASPRHRGSAVLRHPMSSRAARDTGHPTPKPVELMCALLAKAPPGVVADPFAGSGATLLAARVLGVGAVGVELDERYAEIAARRLARAAARQQATTTSQDLTEAP